MSSVQQQLANAQMMDAALSNVEQEQDEADVSDGNFHIYYVEDEAAGMFYAMPALQRRSRS